ncbi:unnamed protein product, partial [Iphiclides podalirius]
MHFLKVMNHPIFKCELRIGPSATNFRSRRESGRERSGGCGRQLSTSLELSALEVSSSTQPLSSALASGNRT